MVVRSPSISLTIEERPVAYVLTIGVDKTTGVVGETFEFSGRLSFNGYDEPDETVNLVLEGVGVVGSDVTSRYGWYHIFWTADRSGAPTFHAEAPAVGAVSGELALGIPGIPYLPLLRIAGPLVAGAALVLLSR